MAAAGRPLGAESGNQLGSHMNAPVATSDDYNQNAWQLQSQSTSKSPHACSLVLVYCLATEECINGLECYWRVLTRQSR